MAEKNMASSGVIAVISAFVLCVIVDFHAEVTH